MEFLYSCILHYMQTIHLDTFNFGRINQIVDSLGKRIRGGNVYLPLSLNPVGILGVTLFHCIPLFSSLLELFSIRSNVIISELFITVCGINFNLIPTR